MNTIFQAPLYPTVSEDPSEEPLEWEPVDELEFDEEITIGQKSILADVISRRKSPEKKMKPVRIQLLRIQSCKFKFSSGFFSEGNNS